MRANSLKPAPAEVQARSGPFFWLIPSVTDLWFVVLLVTLSVGAASSRLLGDAGIGWHIRNGQQMLAAHTITGTDSFSVTMQGHPWFAWEWLYDLGIAAIHQVSGLNGVVFFTALVIAFSFALALRIALARGANLLVTIPLLVLSVSAATIHFLARPHVLSWLFSLIWFAVLDRAATNKGEIGERRIYWLPVLMIFWVNLHGGFLLGLILLICYLADALARGIASRKLPQGAREVAWFQRLAAVTGLSFLASLLNPYGFNLYIHVYRYLTDRFLMDHINEFLSPDFHGLAQKCFAALLLITMAALALKPAKLPLAHLLVIVFAAYSGLYSSRNLPVSSLLLTLIIAPLLSAEVAEAGMSSKALPRFRSFLTRSTAFGARMNLMERSFRGHLWPLLAILIGFWACGHNGKLGSSQIMNAHFDAKRFPVEAANVIAQRGIRESIFAPDFWGGYLIYRLYPQNQVFVDDRHDLYGSEFFRQYLQTVHVAPDWEKMLNDDHVRWVLVPVKSPLANILRESKDWTSSYADATAALFQRSGS